LCALAVKNIVEPTRGWLRASDKVAAERGRIAAFMPLQRAKIGDVRIIGKSLENRALKRHECRDPSGLVTGPDDGLASGQKILDTTPFFVVDGCHEHESLITADFLKTTAAATAAAALSAALVEHAGSAKNRPRRK